MELPIEVQFEHVCGHQDDSSSLTDIPRLGQLNVIVDALAKEHLDSLIAQRLSPEGLGPCDDNLDGEGWTICLDGVKMTGDPMRLIRQHTLGEPLQDHMARKGILCQDAFSHVDWQSTECTMEESAPLHHLWAAKHVHGWCAVGKCMKQWKLWSSSACPCCGSIEETSRHVNICQDARMREVWDKKINGLEAWLDESDAAPMIHHCIVSSLHTGSPLACFEDNSAGLARQAVQDQDFVGWHNMLEGQMSMLW